MQTKVMFYLIIFALGTLTSKRAQREYDRRLVLALTDFQMVEPFSSSDGGFTPLPAAFRFLTRRCRRIID